jgi:glutamyl-Q tRNA(Asp) synthetase
MSSPFRFRFAPSPNGRLHLGHALSALHNASMAHDSGGEFLVRIEDIDAVRCTPENISAAIADLHWLGLDFAPPLYQSTRHAAYADALALLQNRGLLYACTCTRTDLAQNPSPTLDPDGQPHYAGTCRNLRRDARGAALRLDMAMAKAMAGIEHVTWMDKGEVASADPGQWGDVILARKDIGTSYHLSVVVDDAFQGISHVVRGQDLFQATSIHRLLQILLGLPEPQYHHHALVQAPDGRKLAKSKGDESLADLRARGWTAPQVRHHLGFA